MDAKHLIGRFEFAQRKADTFLPDVDVFSVAALQFDQLIPTNFSNSRIRRGALICFLVDPDQFGNWIALECRAIEKIFPPVNHHAELSAPITDMIVANNLMTKKRSDP